MGHGDNKGYHYNKGHHHNPDGYKINWDFYGKDGATCPIPYLQSSFALISALKLAYRLSKDQIEKSTFWFVN